MTSTTNWYRLPCKRARILILIIAISNIPTKISAGKMIEMSLPTFSNVSVKVWLTCQFSLSVLNYISVSLFHRSLEHRWRTLICFENLSHNFDEMQFHNNSTRILIIYIISVIFKTNR